MIKEEIKVEEIISIPENRIGNLVGKGGSVKKAIEKQANVKLIIKDGVVTILGESLNILKTKDVIKAIGFGFPKDQAFELLEENTQITIFDIDAAVPESQRKRIFGRIIGERGRVKTFLENKLQLRILITSEKVGAIGDPMRSQILREVLEKLLKGATHANVYKYLERRLASVENL